MKIIIIGAQYIGSISGGGGVHVVELTRELGKLGHQVTVLCMGLGKHKNRETVVLTDPHNPDSNKRQAAVKIIRFRVKDSAYISTPFEGDKQTEIDRLLEFRNKMLAYLIDHNGDEVVHIHGHFVVPALAREIKEKRLKYKVVTSIHTVESISEIKKGRDGAGPKFIKIMQDMEKDAIAYSDHLILRSKKVVQQVREFLPGILKKNRVTIVSSGVSSLFIHEPAYSESKLARIKKKYNIQGDLILNLNRLDPSKAIETIITAYPHLYRHLQKTRGKDYRLSLAIAGMIEQKNQWYYKRLVTLINQIKEPYIRKSISLSSNIPEKDKVGLFNLAKIFVLTSLLEPFGITIVEALAKSIPVVASGVEGPRDIMNRKNVASPFSLAPGGVLVDYEKASRRAAHMFAALAYVYDNPEKIHKSVLQGRQKTLQKYAWEALVKEKLKVYQKVL